jgi:hypothetical protein
MSLLISFAAETDIVAYQIIFYFDIIPAFRQCLPSRCITGVICVTIFIYLRVIVPSASEGGGDLNLGSNVAVEKTTYGLVSFQQLMYNLHRGPCRRGQRGHYS